MRAADRIAWIAIAASRNTNAPAVPVPDSLGTMADIAKAAPARIRVGFAITGKGMKMLNCNWIVTLYNARDDEYGYHTVFCAEQDLSAVCENLAGMLTDLIGSSWEYHDATPLSTVYPL